MAGEDIARLTCLNAVGLVYEIETTLRESLTRNAST